MEALEWVLGGEGLTHGWEREALPPADRVPPARPSSPPRPAGLRHTSGRGPLAAGREALGGRVDSGPGEG